MGPRLEQNYRFTGSLPGNNPHVIHALYMCFSGLERVNQAAAKIPGETSREIWDMLKLQKFETSFAPFLCVVVFLLTGHDRIVWVCTNISKLERQNLPGTPCLCEGRTLDKI